MPGTALRDMSAPKDLDQKVGIDDLSVLGVQRFSKKKCRRDAQVTTNSLRKRDAIPPCERFRRSPASERGSDKTRARLWVPLETLADRTPFKSCTWTDLASDSTQNG